MNFMQAGARLCALAVGAILLAAGISSTGVSAADLGASCCADLEDRVAELEATTARKGNRNVSLQVYGQVNRALLIWNDGFTRDAYIVDNDTSSSRLGLIGDAQIKPGWLTGYRVEIEFKDAASDEVSNGNDEGSTAQRNPHPPFLLVHREREARARFRSASNRRRPTTSPSSISARR